MRGTVQDVGCGHHVGDATQVLALADAGYRTALDWGSPLTAARCAGMQGRAHALFGDRRACDQACGVAERILSRVVAGDEPAWIGFFTSDQLSAEMLYMAGDLGRQRDVQRLAPDVIASAGGLDRLRVLRSTTVAASYLPSQGNSSADVDHAAELLCHVIPTLGSLHSAVILHRINVVRHALVPYAGRSSVQELEHRLAEYRHGTGHPQ